MPDSNRWFILLAAIFLLFALIDILTGETGLTTDGTNYLRLAENLFSGKGYTLHGERHTVFPPGYPLLIGLFSILIRDYMLAGQIISIISTIGAAYILLTMLKGKDSLTSIAIGFAAIFLFNWTVLRLSVLTLSDPLYIFLMLLNLKLMLGLFDSPADISIRPVCALGLINGYMYLARTEGLIVYAINLVFLLALGFRKPALKPSRIILYILCFLLIALPYVGYLRVATGGWTLAGKSMNLTICEKITSDDPYIWEKTGYKLLDDGRNVMITSAATSGFDAGEYIRSNKEELANRALRNAVSYMKAVITSLGLLILLFAYIPKRIKEPKMLYPLLLTVSSLYLLILSIGRYWISYFPAMLLIAYLGASSYIRRYRRPAVVSALILSALAANIYAGRAEFAGIFRSNDTYKIEQRAAEWIEGNIGRDTILLLRKPEVAYFGNRQWLRMPWFERSGELIDYMRRNGLEYFILSDNERETRPFLAEDENNGAIDEYAVVVKQIDYGGSDLKIMKIRDEYRQP